MDLTKEKSNLMKMAGLLMLVVAVFFLVKIFAEFKSYKYIGGGVAAGNTMSFDGQGEVKAVPDLATIRFSISEVADKTENAQNKVTAKETAVLSYLDKNGIAKKDIKTEDYSSYPKYDYGKVCYEGIGPCTSSPKLLGWEVSESISVKIHDLTKVGDIVKGLGSLGVDTINGPDFSIENEDELKAQARKLAIEEAKAKAKSLEKDLGVRLVRIVNFSENGNYPMPYYYAKDAVRLEAGAASNPAPELPTGENKIVSNVSITYEIR